MESSEFSMGPLSTAFSCVVKERDLREAGSLLPCNVQVRFEGLVAGKLWPWGVNSKK